MKLLATTLSPISTAGVTVQAGWPIWLPYVQLIRLSPPIGIISIYLPHLFGLLHAAILQHTPLPMLLRSNILILGGNFFLSNAIHIWNDLTDAPLDALVERTGDRPIPRGAVSPFDTVVFTTTQAVGASLCLPYLPTSTAQSAIYAIPGSSAGHTTRGLNGT